MNTCVFYGGQQGLIYNTITGGTIANCQFVNNTASTGLSIVALTSVNEMTIENTYVIKNVCSGVIPTTNVPIVDVLNSTDLKWINIHVNNNSNAGSATAGVKVENGTNVLFQNSEFNNNVSGLSDSYGLWLSGCSMSAVEGCTANGNVAYVGTGVAIGFYLDSGTGCSIVDSVAKNQQGILTTSGIKIITSQDCYIARNQVINNTGFGIWTDINSGGSSISVFQNYADQSVSAGINYVGFVVPITQFNKTAPGFTPAPAIFDNVSAVV